MAPLPVMRPVPRAAITASWEKDFLTARSSSTVRRLFAYRGQIACLSIIDRGRVSAKQQPLVLRCLGGPGALLVVLADIDGSMLVLRNVGQSPLQ